VPNRLAQETSPYLLQHKDNPVDWYPWGPEALARARDAQKPIFLSVGYAACHWCHVMEHESFEDPETAAYLNAHFVPVKVDREERPDLDALYMEAVQAMTGHGGWPMSVFLTPEGKPFFGGTYFPGQRRYGMPSFRDVLEGVAEAWTERRDEVERSGRRVADAISAGQRLRVPEQALDASTLETAEARLADSFDRANGSWGGAPKFPQPMTLEYLLRRAAAAVGDDPRRARLLGMVTRTLDAMADGGIRDQLGGGFHRYSTDEEWLVPHFEKMLYDNAQLARVYLHAWQLTGEPRYREVVESTIDYVAREMTLPEGGFAASQDADSPGADGHPEEGAFYVWTPAGVESALAQAGLRDEAALVAAAYDVRATGNWEGRTILRRVRSDTELASVFGAAIDERLTRARRALFETRERRARPARDDKVLAAWNGLMLAALAEAARALDRPDYRALAERNAAFLLEHLRTMDGGRPSGRRLRRSWKDGRATLNAYLEDHADLAEGLLALYETTFEARWFTAARELADEMLRHFADPEGGFFDTSDDHETLVARPKGLQDNAVPSGNALAATVLLRLAAWTGEGRYRDAAEAALRLAEPYLGRHPTAFGQWLAALDFALAPVREIAIVGDPTAMETRALLRVVLVGYRPHQVVAVGDDGADIVPLLADRPAIDGRPTAYVCRSFVCERPVTEPAELAALL
jgi:hypothetical protein